MNNGPEKNRVLLIEDDTALADSLQRVLEPLYLVEKATTADEGLGRMQTAHFDVVVTDWHLREGGGSGLQVIEAVRRDRPRLPIILMTGDDATDTAIEATKLGAYEYLLKPIDLDEFVALIEKAVAASVATCKPEDETKAEVDPDAIIGRSRGMQKVYKEIGQVAGRPVTILIRGETGTGKELVARALHRHGDRRARPFIIVNCVAIPETLLESELFGHEKGAFTGAQSERLGKFEQANLGTIFLDEIGDMSLGTQAKLLRVLQDKAIQRVGGKDTIQVDVRVIAATHCDLERAMTEKKFREDLYYRLNDATIHLPPLRERSEDIPDLVNYFLSREQARSAAGGSVVEEDALRFLQKSPWPGNVRELRNVIQQALLLAQGRPINLDIIQRGSTSTSAGESEPKRTLRAQVASLLDGAGNEGSVEAVLTEWAERELYGQAATLAGGDQTKIARWLGVSRPTVRERMLRYDLHSAGEGEPAG